MWVHRASAATHPVAQRLYQAKATGRNCVIAKRPPALEMHARLAHAV
jgi:hypothetical protein